MTFPIRAYRNAILPHEATEMLFTGADIHFDSSIIHVFSLIYFAHGDDYQM
jgi:HD-GYP domain-containing protein (c-di-GMP phosphodiesterase class II)